MKKLLLAIVFILLINQFCYSQNFYPSAALVFKENYKDSVILPYNGKINVNGNYVQYGDKVLSVPEISDTEKLIFTRGIFHANIITGNNSAYSRSKEEISKMSEHQLFFYNIQRTDSIFIGGNFNEMKSLNPNHQTKRYVFWLWQKGMMNPPECYFELQNKEATEKTTLKNFILGSKVTFFYRGGIIL